MNVSENVYTILQQIDSFEKKYHRTPHSVTLIAVSKGQKSADILSAITANIDNFAENYIQEAIPKIRDLQILNILPNWHFIGRIQSNKIHAIARNFSFVHSLTNLQHGKLLHEARGDTLSPLNICIQIAIKDLTNAAGVSLDEVHDFIKALSPFNHLRIRGLMCMLKSELDFNQQREGFKTCHMAFQALKDSYAFLDTLSMGMSEDFEAAIAEGATMVRIGTAIFGKRQNF